MTTAPLLTYMSRLVKEYILTACSYTWLPKKYNIKDFYTFDNSFAMKEISTVQIYVKKNLLFDVEPIFPKDNKQE